MTLGSSALPILLAARVTSLGLAPFCVCSFPWQRSQSSCISYVLGPPATSASPSQSPVMAFQGVCAGNLIFHTLLAQLLSGAMEIAYNLFILLLSMPVKPASCIQLPTYTASLRDSLTPLISAMTSVCIGGWIWKYTFPGSLFGAGNSFSDVLLGLS